MIMPRLVFIREECAPQHWLRPEHSEEICCDSPRVDLLRILHAGDGESSSRKRAHILENAILFLEIQKVGRREHHSTVPATTPWFYAPDHHELLRVLVRKWAKDCGVQRAENGRIHTDAQGQCQHGDGSISAILAQHAQADAQILPAGFNEGFPAGGANDGPRNFEIALFQAHGAKRISAAHAVVHFFYSRHVEEIAELFIQLPFDSFLSEQ